MKLLLRFCAWFVMRNLERQFDDEVRCMRECSDTYEFSRIYRAHQITRAELATARATYSALLPVGVRKTWRTA